MGRKILLADDSITIQKVVNLTFSDEGIEVITVGNGELAVRKMNEVRPDIVLADVYMPGKTGYEVCEFVKTNPQFAHIPVLLLVGAFEPFDPAEATRVKADGHLTKPFESRALVATVSKLLASAPATPPVATPPVAAPPIAVAPPIASIPVPQSWQPIPSDATTTRLSPEMANRYQENFSIENKQEPFRASPVMASPVTPIQASPVMASPVTPIQASPVMASPAFPESFSDNTQEAFSSPFANAAVSASTPETSKVFTFDSYDFNNPPAVVEKQPQPEQLEIDRGPVFDLDSPLPPPEPTYELDISDISYTTAEQKLANQTVFDPSKDQVDSNAQPNLSYGEQSEEAPAEEMNLDFQDEQFEATKIMGSPLRKAIASYSSPQVAEESQSELSLDVELSANQSATNAPTEIGYDDFTPLDLEPLDEVIYQNENPSDNVLDVSSEPPSHHEEMSNFSEVDVFEPFTAEIKREPLLDVEEESPSMPTIAYPSGEALNIGGRITGSQEVARITNTIPQLAPPQPTYQPEPMVVSQPNVLETPVVETSPVFSPAEQESAASPLEEVAPETQQKTQQETQQESASSAFEEDESPSQFELEQAPAGYYNEGISEGYDQVSEEPLADLVTIPEPEPPTYSPTVAPAALFEEPVSLAKTQQEAFETGEETIPTTEVMSAPAAFAAMDSFSEGVEASELSSEVPPQVLETPPPIESIMATETPTRKFQPISREPEFSEPIMPPAQPAAVAITSIEQIPQPIIDEIARRVVEATPVLAQPVVAQSAPAVAITSIEQIPQHLVDEIVRRAISQISESIVREIVWEVVPDLAEILIKKQLEKIK